MELLFCDIVVGGGNLVLNLEMFLYFELNEEDQPALLDFLEFQPYFFL